MGQEILTGLIVLYIHIDINIDGENNIKTLMANFLKQNQDNLILYYKQMY